MLLVLGSGAMTLATSKTRAGSLLHVLSSDEQSIVVELSVTHVQTETVEHEGQTYRRLIIPGMTQTRTPGAPQVPTRGTLLGVPSTKGIAVHVIDAAYDTLHKYRLFPAPVLLVRHDTLPDPHEGDIQPTFTLNHDLYSTNGFYPGVPVTIGRVGSVRDQLVAQMQFYPVQYYPVTDEVRLYRRIRAQITWDRYKI
jgi:hypothetical protein